MARHFNLFFVLLVWCFASLSHAQQNPQKEAQEFLLRHKQRLFEQFRRLQAERAVTDYGAIDARYYELRIAIDYTAKQISGSVRARFTATRDSLRRFALDLDDHLTVDSLLGAVKSYNHRNNVLNIELDSAQPAGRDFEVRIFYHGHPRDGGYAYFRFDEFPEDGSPHVWTLSEPYGASYWWPCKDTPRDKADSADIYVTVPVGDLVGSNGLLRSVTPNGDSTQTFHWQERYPIATYLISLATGPYAHFQDYYHYGANDSMLLDYYVYPRELGKARHAFQEVPDYLTVLSERFGPYPFLKEKYGMAQFAWGGAMEHQTLTSTTRVAAWWRFVFVHELAHQWFGDAVTCASWQDIWLNEGFATYAEALYAEQRGFGDYPPGPEAYHQYMATKYYTEEKTIWVTDTSDVWNVFDKVVYHKGAWLLHMLRHVIGDSAFFTSLKQYVTDPRWAYGSVRTENFRSVCERVSGKDLQAFFDQWLFYPFYPIYNYQWEITDQRGGNFRVRLTIEQTQTQTIYRMPIDVTVYFVDGSDSTFTIENEQASQEYTLSVHRLPVEIALDKDNWILKEAYGSYASAQAAAITFHTIYPNPFRDRVTILLTNWGYGQQELQIVDILGKEVRRLKADDHSRNFYIYHWDGKTSAGRRAAPGIYFIRPYPYLAGVSEKIRNRKILLLH
ncbi:MAG TPA: T9SS type A sorting domain-containing protein [Caldithrix abyssi]|uniref:Aminopeptidase N n=1 Tax=Caldithrix abyssi TaxID=187145 RepID=A0A7V5UEK4_CALAY|nr:T9SS type A sorting domain-containing protein [Caldithrix abyssi]